MRIFNKKLLIPAMIVLLLSVSMFSMLTFMFADEDNGASKNVVAAAEVTEGKTLIDYIIDNSYNVEDGNDNIYHVLEIYTGTAPSKLKNMVDQGGAELKFENLVINGHKSEQQSQKLNTGTIHYEALAYNTANDTLIQAINSADLIYLSEDPGAKWNASNGIDLTEEIKNSLSKYATSDEKPLIIDSHTLTQQYESLTAKNIKTLATNTYALEGATYSTYKWPSTSPVGTFMNMADLTDLYMPVRGNTQSANWTVASYSGTVEEGQTAPNDIKIAKILTISKDPANGTLTKMVKENFAATAYALPEGYSIEPADFIDANTFELTKGSDFYKFAYSGLGSRPDAVKFTSVDTDTEADVNWIETADLSQYDFVIIEADAGDLDLSAKTGVYDALQSAMYSGVHILYDSSLDQGDATTPIADVNAPNYEYVFNKVANTNDTPRYGYVLVTAKAKMDIYYNSKKPKGVKDIADIINGGTFRGIKGGGTGDSSNVYTVLEIEPCYPINTTLAKKFYDIREYLDPLQKNHVSFVNQGQRQKWIGQKQYQGPAAGFYYLRTDQVSDSTTDEISYGDGYSFTSLLDDLEYYNANASRGDLTADETAKVNAAKANIDKYFLTAEDGANNTVNDQVANITDYYDWALSRAKIAHATGRSYDQVKVVHMSSVEFATSRKTLLDNYDAIYIGGNNSAIKDIISTNGSDTTNAWYLSSLGGNYYTMYFHNGDAYPIDDDTYSTSVGDQFAFGLFAGNDLTQSKYKELLTYASKMPVIIDKRLSDAFRTVESSTNAYDQHVLDPESNMYAFLKTVMTYDSATGAVTSNNDALTLVDFDPSYTYKALNPDNKYGDTYGGYVTVFRGDTLQLTEQQYYTDAEKTVVTSELENFDAFGVDVTDYKSYKAFADTAKDVVNESKLSTVLNHTARPLLAVLSTPMIYSEDDKTTWIDPNSALYKSKGLVWSVSVSEPADITVYCDNDGNGRFSDGESIAKASTETANAKVTLSYKPGASYYGVVYWKVEAVSKSSKLKVSTTNVSKIKRTNQEKMYVNLLQIMAGRSDQEVTGGTNTSNRTLFLCTECQYAKNVLHGNRYTNLGMFFAKVDTGANTFKETNSIEQVNNLSSVDSIKNTLVEFEPDYDYPITNLGYHTHDFGITKYYSDLVLSGEDGGAGYDDISTNWFDVISDDYDVDTTILYTNEIEEKINEIKNDYAGLTKAQVEAKVGDTAGGYTATYNKFDKYYNAMKDIINGEFTKGSKAAGYTLDYAALESAYPGFVDALVNKMTSSAQFADAASARSEIEKYATASFYLDDYIIDHKSDMTSSGKKKEVTAEKLGQYLDKISNVNQSPSIPRDKRKYYDIYNNYSEFSGVDWIAAYTTYFCQWRDAKIFENFFFEMYQKYLLYASYDYDLGNVVLSNVYDCIALGAAEGFYGDDLNDDATTALSRYIDDQGNLILFHDTLSSVKGATTNMTNDLSTKFGMNARHMYVTYDTFKLDNTVKLYVNGEEHIEPIDMSYGIGTKTLTYKQLFTKEGVQADVGYNINGTPYTFSDIDNDAKSYTVDVTKNVEEISKVDMYVTDADWKYDQDQYTKLEIPVTASEVTINSDYSFTIDDVADNPDEGHVIKVNNNSSKSLYVALGGHTKSDIVCNPLNNNNSYELLTEGYNEYYDEIELAYTSNYDINANFGAIPRDAAEITLHVTHENNNFKNAKFEVTKTTTDTGYHKVTIITDFQKINCNDWYNPGYGKILTINTKENPGKERYKYTETDISATSIDIDNCAYSDETINNISNDKMTVITYDVGKPVKSSDSYATDEYGAQSYIFNFTDGTNAISGEPVTCTINGETKTIMSDEEGHAVFYRNNYTPGGYVYVPKYDEQTTTTGNTNQTLTVKVIDQNDNPVSGVEVKAVQTSDYSNSSETKDTSASGMAVFTYQNYYDASSGTGVVTSEPGYGKAKGYFVSTVLANSAGVESFNYAPRMLGFKGFFVNANEGQLNTQYNTMMYKYSLYHSKVDESSNNPTLIGAQDMQATIDASSTNGETMPTDKTKKNNEGIITKYPFGIGDRMKVSATTPQSYAVDIEDDDLVVYYTLAGGSQGTTSSAFASDPMDGVNNYFLYQYGSITYTGAGHALITGRGRNNNDERRLFINIIVNSGRKSIKGPSLNLYDLGATEEQIGLDAEKNTALANAKIKPAGGEGYDYYTEIEDLSDFDGFDFLANIAGSSTISKVLVYYDINHTDNGNSTEGVYKYEEGTDQLILQSDRVNSTDATEAILENQLKEMSTDSTRTKNLAPHYDSSGNVTGPGLALREEYFDPQSGGQYAYIVVQVWDSNNEEATAILRIQYKPALIDLN